MKVKEEEAKKQNTENTELKLELEYQINNVNKELNSERKERRNSAIFLNAQKIGK